MTIIIDPPDGFDNVEYVILVNREQLMGHRVPEYCVAVMTVRPEMPDAIFLEEVGCGPIGVLLTASARVIRDSVDLNTAMARHPAGKAIEASIARGLAQSAKGEVVDLGDFPYVGKT